jgi:predicted ATP-grasp superfamily ATP-dependent carboligase
MTSVPATNRQVLVAGISTRAIAESAARAGFSVTAIDAYADLDNHPAVRTHAIADFSAPAAAQASRAVDCDAVVYLSSFENYPDAVELLACGRRLWGNAPEVLRAVRDPHRLAAALATQNLPCPSLSGNGQGPWLLKPLASGGGTGIRPWQSGEAVPAGHYVQEFIDGQPGSLLFVASEGNVAVLGISTQLIGLDAFGAGGYRYCGSILDGSVGPDSWMWRSGGVIATTIAAGLGLVGVNGIDFIARDGVLYPVEVNPRWSASLELIERAGGVSMFAVHAAACAAGRLPADHGRTVVGNRRSIGKAVLFARHDLTVGDSRPWCADASVRDVPRPGTVIRRGTPVCTLFAEGETPASCRHALEARADQTFSALRQWSGVAQ